MLKDKVSKVYSKDNVLLVFTLLGVFCGIGLGTILRIAVVFDKSEERQRQRFIIYLGFAGEIMMRAFKMTIIPLLTTSIISGITNLGGRSSGRLAKLAFIYYIFTTVSAIILGIILVLIIQPGKVGMTPNSSTDVNNPNTDEIYHAKPLTELQFMDLARNLIPDNVFYATVALDQTGTHKDYTKNVNLTSDDVIYPKKQRLGSPNVLGIVMLAVIVAGIMTKLGDTVKPLKQVIDAVSEVILKGVMYIMWLVPVGVLSLIAKNLYAMEGEISVLAKQLGLYMVTVMTGLLIHWWIVLPIVFVVITKSNPYKYMAGLSRALATAFGSSSSSCALPITMQCCEESLGIDKRISRFILPLGCTVNMDGTALMEGVAAIAISQMEGAELSIAQIFSLSITATLASIGASSIPSSGLIMLTMILTSLGVSDRAIAYLWSIDWLLDRFRTVTNVWGDAVGCAVVQQLSKDVLAADSGLSIGLSGTLDSDQNGNFTTEHKTFLANSPERGKLNEVDDCTHV